MPQAARCSGTCTGQATGGDPTIVRILSALERLTTVEALADCPVSLHTMGIIHGDVKDDKVLLRRREDLSSVRLTDLRLWTPICFKDRLGCIKYPACNFAPEQLGPCVPAPSTDVGQLGVLHLELATSRPSPHRIFLERHGCCNGCRRLQD
jgi:serine/threonine protein kinase